METKTCTRCNNTYTLDNFHNNRGKKRCECKKCWNEITKNNLKRIKQMMVDDNGGKCSICGYSKCLKALEFHHLDPSQKEISLTSKHVKSYSEKVKRELKKCILLCANCHRELHDN